MKTINEELNELKAIMKSDSPDKEEKYKEQYMYICRNYTSEQDKEAISDYLLNGLKDISTELDEIEHAITIREKLKEMKEIVPVSYIARNYFGKSASWLQQRIYGYKVRGRVYTLSEQDKQIFDNAIRDICKKLGSLSIA